MVKSSQEFAQAHLAAQRRIAHINKNLKDQHNHADGVDDCPVCGADGDARRTEIKAILDALPQPRGESGCGCEYCLERDAVLKDADPDNRWLAIERLITAGAFAYKLERRDFPDDRSFAACRSVALKLRLASEGDAHRIYMKAWGDTPEDGAARRCTNRDDCPGGCNGIGKQLDWHGNTASCTGHDDTERFWAAQSRRSDRIPNTE